MNTVKGKWCLNVQIGLESSCCAVHDKSKKVPCDNLSYLFNVFLVCTNFSLFVVIESMICVLENKTFDFVECVTKTALVLYVICIVYVEKGFKHVFQSAAYMIEL